MSAVIANFYAPWCPWCQRLEPTWEAVREEVHAKYPDTDGRIHLAKVCCCFQKLLVGASMVDLAASAASKKALSRKMLFLKYWKAGTAYSPHRQQHYCMWTHALWVTGASYHGVSFDLSLTAYLA